MSVAVNPPKSPVTEGSNEIAAATLPNICKMPGPPAPFVPTPLPNIGKSNNSPQGYSTTVTIEGNAVAIHGATFNSMGDVASQGTGGGLISSNVQGPTSFIAPGSLDVAIEGKAVQLLGDQMLNNCGPSGSPANSATMGGTMQAPALGSLSPQGLKDLAKDCNKAENDKRKKKSPPKGKECTKLGTKKHKCCENAINQYKADNPDEASKIDSEVPFKKTGDTYSPTSPAQESAARGAANDAYTASGGAKGVWASTYFANGGAAFKADVIMKDDEGIEKAFDFKFNCKDKGTMSKPQEAKYKAAGFENVTVLHVPGHL